MQLAPTTITSNDNPWGFPALDTAVATRALDGLAGAEQTLNRMIDRSIAVRVKLDADLKAGVFSPDTLHAVDLLVRARDYAYEQITSKHLPGSVTEPVFQWIRENDDERINVVSTAFFDAENAVYNLLDDDEGNNRERIERMREEPSSGAWLDVRGILDDNIGMLYAAREMSSARHVLSAAGGLS